MRRYELIDEQWEKIKHYIELPNKNGRPYKDLGATVNGIIWIVKSGSSWRDLPSRYEIGTRFINVSVNGKSKIFSKKLKDLALDCDLQDVSIDSTTVKVHQDAGSKKKNR